MSRFRLLLAWFLMAALPLQGMAAVSMLFCGSATAVRLSASSGEHAGHHNAASPKHDHASHGNAAPDAGQAIHVSADDGASSSLKADASQNGHACPICASCCQVVAVGAFAAFPQLSVPPGAEPLHPSVRVVSRTTPLPDKPPRA